MCLKLDFERTLVTGGAGFIGSHIVDRILAEGCKVTVIDNLSTGTKKNLTQHGRNRDFNFTRADILDTATLKQAMKDMERVFHEAAIVSIEYATRNPIETSRVNVQGTLSVLEAARQQDTEQLIYASSAAVYGDCQTLPISENTSTNPISSYGASKLAGEHFVRAYHHTYGLKTTCLRSFTIYGPRQTQNPYSGVISIFLQRLLAGKPIEIQGDGTQTRDFIYATDVAEANLRAASAKSAVGEVFNIATGKPTSINQLAELLGFLLKQPVKRRSVSPRPGDIRHSYAETRKARELLVFKTRVSLREGLKRYIDWLEPT